MMPKFLSGASAFLIDKWAQPRWQYTIIFLVSFAVLALRRPDAIINAQFWAEDGHYWFAQAYNNGVLETLFQPQNGYLQTISRITASLSLLLPLTIAPLFFNLAAIFIQILPLFILWSDRFNKIIPSLKGKILITVFYLLMPHSYEVHANITNAHWHLALAVFMLLIAAPPPSKLIKGLEYLLTSISAISGPFSIILAPIALIQLLRQRNRHTMILTGLICMGALIQLSYILLSADVTRSNAPLGASVDALLRIISSHIIIGSSLGHDFVAPFAQHRILPIATAILGLALATYALIKGPWALKLLIPFSSLVLAAGLASPQVSLTMPQWEVLLAEDSGNRYFFLPMLAWFCILVWLASRGRAKDIFIGILGLCIVGAVLDFRYPPFTDYNYAERVKNLQEAPLGTAVDIPLNPVGWNMTLIAE